MRLLFFGFAAVLMCSTIFINGTEEIFRVGLLLSHFDTSLYEIHSYIEQNTTNSTFQINITALDADVDNAFGGFQKDFVLLKKKNISAVIGPYSPSLANVTQKMRVPFIVTSMIPRGNIDSAHIIEMFPGPNNFISAVIDLSKYFLWKKVGFFYDNIHGQYLIERMSSDTKVDLKSYFVTPSSSTLDIRNYLRSARDHFIHRFIVWCNNFDLVHEMLNEVVTPHWNECVVPMRVTTYVFEGIYLSLLSNPNSWLIVNTGLEVINLDAFTDSRANLTQLAIMADHHSKCNVESAPLTFEAAVLHDAVQIFNGYIENRSMQNNKRISIRKTLRKIGAHGCTGNLTFTRYGKRIEHYLQLIPLNGSKGTWRSKPSDLKERIDQFRLYSGNDASEEDLFSRPLRVTTKIELPFVQYKQGWEEAGLTGNDRFEGFAIDILKEMSKILDFDYNLYLVPDNKFGSLKSYGWTGMINELLAGRADLALAPFYVTPDRSSVVPFTQPYMTKGTSVVLRKPKRQMWIFQFLMPLSKYVWIAIFCSYLVVGFVLFGVSRINSDRHKKIGYNLRESFWYIWGTLLRGSLNGAPQAVSGRIVSSAWWFFSLIVISIYTANLAAFLTIDNAHVSIKSAADLAYQTEFNYGTVDGSQIEDFFNFTKINHYSKMWAHMDTAYSRVRRVEDGFNRSLKEKYAFLWDSPIVRHVTSLECDLMEVGNPFDLRGYAFPATPHSSLSDKLSQAILELNDKGILYELEGHWWRRPLCADMRKNAKTTSLELETVAGMFLILLAGMTLSVILCVIQYFLSKAKNRKKNSDKRTCRNNGQPSPKRNGDDHDNHIPVPINHVEFHRNSMRKESVDEEEMIDCIQ